MKRGVYAHQRSGSTLFYEAIAPHMSPLVLGEVFTPHEYQSLQLAKDGSLFIGKHQPKEVPQLRAERAEMLKNSRHDYFIKVFGTDLRQERKCLDAVKDYEFYAIERINAFDAILSGIVALQFWYFHSSDGPSRWTHFKAGKSLFEFMRDAMISYYAYKKHLTIIETILYEHIDNSSRTYGDVCRLAGLPDDNSRLLPQTKLLSLREKAALVQNLGDVIYWYATELDPLLPEDRRGGHLDLGSYR